MRELTKAMFSYTLAAPLFAIQQLANGLNSARSDEMGEKATQAYQNLTRATMDQLGDMLQALFKASDEIQRDMVDMGFRLFEPETWTPSGIARTTADMTSRLADGMRYMDPSTEGLAAWRELVNKLQIYFLVIDIKSKLKIPEGRFDLHEYVDKCYDLGPFPALWAVEGVGHDYAAGFRPSSDKTRDILTDPSLNNIPIKSMTMLHAGIGLSFAQELLEGLAESAPASEIRPLLELFIRLCRQNSRAGYEGAALESLGLYVRNWRSDLVKVTDEQLLEFDEEAASYFWRGAGRSLYFLPVNFVPMYGSIGNAIRMSKRESPHELARNNTLAGVAWASTVVNMQHPEVMESFLNQHGDELMGQDAFANGVASSIIMRYDTTPDEPFIKEFVEHRIDASRSHLVELWDTHVRIPGEDALGKFYPVLRDHHRLGEVFHYQSLARLVESLAN
jgi:hypothetical protein